MPIDNDEAEDFIELFVFVQEMHDKYDKYANAKIPLESLCILDKDKAGGGWIQLEEGAGKVLLSSKYQRSELSRDN